MENTAHHEGMKRFIAAFEQLNVFEFTYLTRIMLETYQEEIAKVPHEPLRTKSFDGILARTIGKAKLYIFEHELDVVKQQLGMLGHKELADQLNIHLKKEKRG